MKLSLAITSFNRSDLAVESFSKVYDHDLIDEIVIVDDCSSDDYFNELKTKLIDFETDHIYAKGLPNKLQLFRNEKNLGMSRNKAHAISKCKNEWTIILDSDNILYPEYLEAIEKNVLNAHGDLVLPGVIYCPQFAEPDFDFSEFCNGQMITKQNSKGFLDRKMFRVFLNCCNYLVNREKYLDVYRYDPNIKEADTIHFNVLWLKAGYSFYFVPGMKYFHRVHKDSGWLQNHKKNIEDANRLQKIIAEL